MEIEGQADSAKDGTRDLKFEMLKNENIRVKRQLKDYQAQIQRLQGEQLP